MAAQYTDSLAGLLLLNDQNLDPGEASAILQNAPYLAVAAAKRASNGTLHKYNRQTVAAGAGFRAIGEGLENVARKVETVTCTLKVLDGTVRRDQAAALGFTDGPDAYMAQEIPPSLAAAFFAAEKQIINGTAQDATGFEGFYDLVTDDMIVDAGGAGGRRVYMLRSAPDAVAVVPSQDGKIEVGDLTAVDLIDGSGNPYPGWMVSVLGWLGVQVRTSFDLAAVVNLDGTTGHTLTRDRLFEAFQRFPAGHRPTHILMDRTSREEYRKSLEGASYAAVDTPSVFEGDIAIVAVDSIKPDASTIATATA